jgi:hypothetical protein
MILEIDTKFLLEHEISAHQYLLLKYASDNDYDAMKKYLRHSKTYDDLKKDMIALYNAGLISTPWSDNATFRHIKPSNKFIQLTTYTGDPFDEFYSIFPVKVLRPDGNYDYLRMDRNRCKKIYHNIVRVNKTMHDHIMECLKLEINERNRTGKMSFMKRMPTWLTSEEWKVYSDKVTAGVTSGDISIQEGEGYGTEIE